MTKSLAELRQSPHVGLPVRTYKLCLASSLIGEVQSLLGDLEDARGPEAAQAEGDEGAAKPKRMGAGGGATKIRKRLSELSAEMVEHTGVLTLRGMTEGAWRLWVDANPAREGNTRDAELVYGICNADALIDALTEFAVLWNDSPMAPGDWDFIKASAAPGDVRALASLVVMMHETVVNIPKLLSSSPGILPDANV